MRFDSFIKFIEQHLKSCGNALIDPEVIAAALSELSANGDWLPERYRVAVPSKYAQYLLHLDLAKRFSIVSFAWSAGVATGVHDHGLWGAVGVVEGAEIVEPFAFDAGGRPIATGAHVRLEPGMVDSFTPADGDLHRVRNAFADRRTVSVHVYGGDIGRHARSTWAADGKRSTFVSGYSNA